MISDKTLVSGRMAAEILIVIPTVMTAVECQPGLTGHIESAIGKRIVSIIGLFVTG